MPRPRWTKDELRLLLHHYPHLSAKQIASRYLPTRTPLAIHSKAENLSIKRSRLMTKLPLPSPDPRNALFDAMHSRFLVAQELVRFARTLADDGSLLTHEQRGRLRGLLRRWDSTPPATIREMLTASQPADPWIRQSSRR